MRFLKWHFNNWMTWAIHLGTLALCIALDYSGDVMFYYFLGFSMLINGIVLYANYRYFKRNNI